MASALRYFLDNANVTQFGSYWAQYHRPLLRCQTVWAWLFWLLILGSMIALADRPVIWALHASPEWVHRLGEGLSLFGDTRFPLIGGPIFIFLSLTVGASFQDKIARSLCFSLAQCGLLATLSVFWSGLVVLVLKRVLGRPRPLKFLEEGLFEWMPLHFYHLHVSMPSGHTTAIFTLAFLGCIFWPKLRWAVLVFALAVGVARVMNLHHWPSDVMAGGVIGWLLSRQVASLFVGPNHVLNRTDKGDYVIGVVWHRYAHFFKRPRKS